MEHIYQTMMGYSFATTTGFEQYNHRCFEDFKAYLRKCISTPKRKILRLQISRSRPNPACQRTPADPVPGATNAAALLKEQIRSYLATQPASDAEADLRFNNIDAQIRTILTLFNTNEQQQLLSVWLKTDTAQLIGDMELENLRLTAYKAYSALHQNTCLYA
ncbi:MAG: hypothetical protein IPN29_02130 [Saprospiraceae bacterium]|nr:hypothetical protein [Saprospiraceae bacterium]